MTKTSHLLAAAAAAAIGSGAGAGVAQEVTLTVESWRADDRGFWEEQVIPAFEAANPGIRVRFAPTSAAEYDTALRGRLAAGTAGDIVACRPFDASLALFAEGYLAPLNELPGMAQFAALETAAWSTDGGKTQFCVPAGSVVHGFIYNAEIFAELGLGVPATLAAFHDVLGRIKADGRYLPMALGVGDPWVGAAVGYHNIGPSFWKGEAGRLALLAGKQKLSDENWVAPYRELARWKAYLGEGFEVQTYSDSQNLFTLGRAAIYPAGSWDIAAFSANAPFEMGAFPPPALEAGDRCYVSEQAEIGFGLNAGSPNLAAARTLLDFVAGRTFGELEANGLPGLYPPGEEPVRIDNPLAREFGRWRETCEPAMRVTDGVAGRGTPGLEDGIRKAVVQVIKGAVTPETVGAQLQAGLDSWYKPRN